MRASPVCAGLLAALLMVGAAYPAWAQPACWAPDRTQAPDRAVARTAPVAALTADIATVSAILKKNDAFARIPGVRLMVTSYIGYATQGFGHAVRVSAGLYPPNTWRDQCTLMAGPEFFNKGHVHVTFNSPDQIFNGARPRLSDESLTAWAEPTGAAAVGAETYYQSVRGVVLTRGRRPAWIPVTTDEWLAYRDRRAAARVGELTRDMATQQASVEQYRADMERQIQQAPDAATKAKLRTAMEEQTAALRSATAGALTELTRLAGEADRALQAVRDERARLSASQLAAQARVEGAPLVKINPALAGGSTRVTLIVVLAVANDRAMDVPLQQAVREMDYAALRALID